MFLAEVERASGRTGTPLAYFRGQFGRLELAHDEQAFLELRARVLSRDIEIGSPLGLDALARRFDLLRTPVYHALTRLTGEGLVARDLQGSFVVTPLTLDAVEQAWRGTLCDRARRRDADGRRDLGRPASRAARARGRLTSGGRPASSGWRAGYRRYNAFHEGLVSLADSAPAARRLPPCERAGDDPQPHAEADGGAGPRPRAVGNGARAHRRAGGALTRRLTSTRRSARSSATTSSPAKSRSASWMRRAGRSSGALGRCHAAAWRPVRSTMSESSAVETSAAPSTASPL